jgi:hypothetical protein
MTVEQHRQPSDPVVTSAAAAADDDDDHDGVPAIFSDLIFFSFFLLFCYFCNLNYVVKEFPVKDVKLFRFTFDPFKLFLYCVTACLLTAFWLNVE